MLADGHEVAFPGRDEALVTRLMRERQQAPQVVSLTLRPSEKTPDVGTEAAREFLVGLGGRIAAITVLVEIRGRRDEPSHVLGEVVEVEP